MSMTDQFDPEAMLDKVVALADSSLGVQDAVIGEPDGYEYKFSAYAMLGPITIIDEASGGYLNMRVEVFAGFSYRVGGDATLAEQVITRAVRDFIVRFYEDRTLEGTISNGQLMFDINSRPIYQTIDEQEFRLYLVRVVGDQHSTILSL